MSQFFLSPNLDTKEVETCVEAETLICEVLGITGVWAFSSEQCRPLWFLRRFTEVHVTTFLWCYRGKHVLYVTASANMLAISTESRPHTCRHSYCGPQCRCRHHWFHFSLSHWTQRKMRLWEIWLGFEVILVYNRACGCNADCSLNLCLHMILWVTSYCITPYRDIKRIKYNYTLSCGYCSEFYSAHYSNW